MISPEKSKQITHKIHPFIFTHQVSPNQCSPTRFQPTNFHQPIFTHQFLPVFRWGWVFFKQMRILSGIQFKTHFIECFVVETKRFFGSSVNVILTWRTCCQQVAGLRKANFCFSSRALENDFPERICYMFLMTQCRGD